MISSTALMYPPYSFEAGRLAEDSFSHPSIVLLHCCCSVLQLTVFLLHDWWDRLLLCLILTLLVYIPLSLDKSLLATNIDGLAGQLAVADASIFGQWRPSDQ